MSAIYYVSIDLGHIGYEVEADTEEQALDIAEQMLKDEMEGVRIENRQFKDRVIQLTNDLDRA